MATKKEIVTEENFKNQHLQATNEALEFIRGERNLTKRHVTLINEPPEFTPEEIKNIRKKLGIGQPDFTQIFGESLSAIRHLEQGNRNISNSARRILDLI